MKQTAPYFPIIYVRGYAATESEINGTVDDPFYGFNFGSSHIRVGADGEPDQFFFESPIVRLMTDYGYRDTFSGRTQSISQAQHAGLSGEDQPDSWRTIWIHRYYDVSATSYGAKKTRRLLVEEAAAELGALIERVKQETGAPLVHLVAHSMGGLVCRSLLQKVYVEAGEDPRDHVARFFTYGTPHGGIQFRTGLGWAEKLRDLIGPFDSDTFGPDRLYQLLTPKVPAKKKAPRNFDPRKFSGPFSLDNVFCAVGTNAADYDVAKGMSSFAAGPQSDGLVQISAAYVEDAHRAYVHRSHSGRYGIVNSEEAFQNLERFLFGTVQAMVSLGGIRELPPTTQVSYQLDLRVAVRGLPVFMNERTRQNYCPVVLNDPAVDELQETYPLFTQFMNSTRAASNDGTCRFALSLALYAFPVRNGKIDYSRSIAGVAAWADQLLIDVNVSTKRSIAALWTAAGQQTPEEVPLRAVPEKGSRAEIRLPEGARQHLGPKAHLLIEAYPWTV
jgi:pimeloyl-ACP methyl ester carboxylesterase